MLAEDERRRAMRFHFARDVARFGVAHGALRTILARYLADADPASLRFVTGPFGKPALADEPAGKLEFNLSHSGGLALCAVARHRVGVDVERIRAAVATDDIAESSFSVHERQALHRVPAGQRVAAFFACWTRKEAYIKARGTGLSCPLDSFDVTLAPGEPAALVATRPDAGDAARWSLASLDVADGYAGAVALEGDRLAVIRWDWIPREPAGAPDVRGQ